MHGSRVGGVDHGAAAMSKATAVNVLFNGKEGLCPTDDKLVAMIRENGSLIDLSHVIGIRQFSLTQASLKYDRGCLTRGRLNLIQVLGF